jgi:hypothetical protein
VAVLVVVVQVAFQTMLVTGAVAHQGKEILVELERYPRTQVPAVVVVLAVAVATVSFVTHSRKVATVVLEPMRIQNGLLQLQPVTLDSMPVVVLVTVAEQVRK